MNQPHFNQKVHLGDSEEFAEGGRLVFDVGSVAIGVFRLRGKLYAYENVCAHQGGPVCQGLMINRVVERLDEQKASLGMLFDKERHHIVCPWHGFEYDISTGRSSANAKIRLKSFSVSEVDGGVYVEL